MAATFLTAFFLRSETKLIDLVLFYFKCIIFLCHLQFYLLAQDTNCRYLAGFAIKCLHDISNIWKFFIQIFISLLLMSQTTHQSATHTGNLPRIQRQILLFCHLDGNWSKLRQMCITAKPSATDANAAENLCLIPHTYLTQLNTCLEYRCQIFDQLTEIHSAIRREIKQYLAVIK